MSLDRDAHVLISSPSANRVYRTESKVSQQHIDITVGPGAILEWVPEHTIPFAGSRFRQILHATLAPGATLLLWDAVASGRIAREERWAFTDLETKSHHNGIRQFSSGANVLDPATDLGCVGLAEEWNYVASFYVVNDAVASDTWSRLELKIASVLDERPGHVLGGVSTPTVPGVAIKLLTRTAPDLTDMLDLLGHHPRRAVESPACILAKILSGQLISLPRHRLLHARGCLAGCGTTRLVCFDRSQHERETSIHSMTAPFVLRLSKDERRVFSRSLLEL